MSLKDTFLCCLREKQENQGSLARMERYPFHLFLYYGCCICLHERDLFRGAFKGHNECWLNSAIQLHALREG